MTEAQERMKKAVEYLANYMSTYDRQNGYMDYSDEIFIDDVIYGLGVALNEEEHSYAGGFLVFKKKLLKHLKNST